MLDDQSSLPTPVPLSVWADTLPTFATEVVAGSDLTQPHIYAQLPARADQAGVVRHRINEWAPRIGLSRLRAQDMVLASDEAVSNAIEHAYGGMTGMVTLFAGWYSRSAQAKIIVADRGRWQPPAADPGFRGRGLAMMERLADMFRLAHTAQGTTVMLGWSLRD